MYRDDEYWTEQVRLKEQRKKDNADLRRFQSRMIHAVRRMNPVQKAELKKVLGL